MEKRKRQEAILSLIRKHAIATQEELVAHLRRAGVRTTQATVSRDIAELGLARVPGSGPGLSRYAQLGEGLGAASTAAREERLQRLLRDLPLTVRRGQGLAVLISTPGSAQPIASALDGTGWSEIVGTVAGDDTVFVALVPQPRAYPAFAQRLARLGAFVERED
jgi:transcriptional regulator of arginine metabolism